MISVKKVDKHFGGVYAVHDCSFDVKNNTITSIIGPNGAGKTTLFNLICGIIQADNGKVFFDKKDITNLSIHKIANMGISRTFQQAKLFKNLSVKENLALAKKCSEEEIKEVLKKVGFQINIETLASELSYGQTRLVEIARALLKPHKLLMLDEPTAGINPKLRGDLKNILLNLKKEGNTILLIEHDMGFVMSISDEVIVMSEGTVLTKGKPQKIKKDKKVLEVYLGK